jgi:mannose-6-phosphate isomerase-like protein (cupin superfamily)
MPFVSTAEAMNVVSLDIDAIARESGDPPWRRCLVGTPGLRVVLLAWPPGYSTIPHVHPVAEEVFSIISGRARFTIGDEPECEVGPGSFLLAERGVSHAIRVPEGDVPLLLLAAVAPNEDRLDETIEPAPLAGDTSTDDDMNLRRTGPGLELTKEDTR